MTRVTVVEIDSLPFSGTTWANLVVASHPDAFALGHADYSWNRRTTRELLGSACRVHGSECVFWTEFARVYREEENFFVQLARFSNKNVLVLNNPRAARQDLEHEKLNVKRIRLVRDGRAVANSFKRHHPNAYAWLPGGAYFWIVSRFWVPSMAAAATEDAGQDTLLVRYEDLVRKFQVECSRISDFLGMKLGEDSLRFWRFEHHYTGGNDSVLSLLRSLKGLRSGDELLKHSERWYRRVAMDAQAGVYCREDQRWKGQLSRRERCLFDLVGGATNARWGYERDHFSMKERDKWGWPLAILDLLNRVIDLMR